MGYKGNAQEKGSKSNVMRKEEVCCVLREAGEPPIWSRNALQS